MAQMTIYLPEKLAERLRRKAKRARKSLSSYVSERLSSEDGPADAWPVEFEALFGACTLETPDDLSAEERTPL